MAARPVYPPGTYKGSWQIEAVKAAVLLEQGKVAEARRVFRRAEKLRHPVRR